MAEFEENATIQILKSAEDAIRERGVFKIVLAGGSTPRNVYAHLRNADTDWAKWHVYFGDERCLPPEDAERNSHMAAAIGKVAEGLKEGAGLTGPLAATGVRLTLTLAREMQRSGVRYGVSSACIGGGQGIALLLENPAAK